MTREQILDLLYSLGKRPSTLAYFLGVNRSLLTQAMDGKGSQKARLKIARLIGKPPSLIWDHVPRPQKVLDDDVYYNPQYYDLD